MRLTGAIVAVAALLAAAPSAHAAAAPFTIGQGVNPRIVVTPNGTAHVAWIVPDALGRSAAVGYCRLPPGATACERTLGLAFPAAGGLIKSGGDVTVQAEGDATIRVVSACYTCAIGDAQEGIQRWTSSDGGLSFSAEPGLGGVPTNTGMGPDGTTLPTGVYVTPADGDQVAARPGTPGSAVVDLVDGTAFVHSPSIVQIPGQTALVYASSDLFSIRTAIFRGPDFAATTLMDPGRWTVNMALPAAESGVRDPRLTSGAGGVWLSYEQRLPLDDHVLVRRFDAGKGVFGTSVSIESSAATDASLDGVSSAQDAAGHLHVIWHTTLQTADLRYSRGDASGAKFSAPVTIARGEPFADPEVAAGPDGTGWAVWHGTGDTPIRVLHVDGTGIDGVTGSSETPDDGTTTRTVVVTISGARITLRVPTGCVRRGKTFRAVLTWKAVKKKGSVFVKVRRADFLINSKVAKVDRRAPFSQTLTVPRTAARGGVINLRARAYIKVKRGKSPKKSIGTKIKVCTT